MKKLVFAAAVCTLGLGACAQLRAPSDQQLTALLRADMAAPADNALLDGQAVDCLRALSGDTELTRGLSMRLASDEGPNGCRARLGAMIADAKRNPANLRLDDFIAPKVVRRVMALQVAHMNAQAEARSSAPAPAPAAVPSPPVNDVDLGPAGEKLKAADALCAQAKDAAAKPDAAYNLKIFGTSCAANLGMMRVYIQRAVKHNDKALLDRFTGSVEKITKAGQEALGNGQ